MSRTDEPYNLFPGRVATLVLIPISVMAPLMNITPIGKDAGELGGDAGRVDATEAMVREQTRSEENRLAVEAEVLEMLRLTKHILKLFQSGESRRKAKANKLAPRKMYMFVSPVLSAGFMLATFALALVVWIRASSRTQRCVKQCFGSAKAGEIVDEVFCSEAHNLRSVLNDTAEACSISSVILVGGMSLWRWTLFASLRWPLQAVGIGFTRAVRAVSQAPGMGDMAPFVVVGIQTQLTGTASALAWLATWFSIAEKPRRWAELARNWERSEATTPLILDSTFLRVYMVVWRALVLLACASAAGLVAGVCGRTMSMIFHHRNHFKRMQKAILSEHIIRALSNPHQVAESRMLQVRGHRFLLGGIEVAHWSALVYVAGLLRDLNSRSEPSAAVRSLAMNVQRRLAYAIVKSQSRIPSENNNPSAGSSMLSGAHVPDITKVCLNAIDDTSVRSERNFGPLVELVIEEARVRTELHAHNVRVTEPAGPSWWLRKSGDVPADVEVAESTSASESAFSLSRGSVIASSRRLPENQPSPPPGSGPSFDDIATLIARHAQGSPRGGIGATSASVFWNPPAEEPSAAASTAFGDVSIHGSDTDTDDSGAAGSHTVADSHAVAGVYDDTVSGSAYMEDTSELESWSNGVTRHEGIRLTAQDCAAVDKLMRERWRQRDQEVLDMTGGRRRNATPEFPVTGVEWWTSVTWRRAVHFLHSTFSACCARLPNTGGSDAGPTMAARRQRTVGSMFRLHDYLSRDDSMRVNLANGFADEEVAVECRKDAWELGYVMFWNLRRPGSLRPYLRRSDVYVAADCCGLGHKGAAWSLLDRDGNQHVSMVEVVNSVDAVHRNRKSIAKILLDSQSVVGQVQKLLHLVLLLALLVTSVVVLAPVSAGRVWTGITAALLGVGFVFGNSIQQICENCIYLLFTHPFDLDDTLMLSGTRYGVSGITLQHCTLCHSDSGNSVHIATRDLANTRITNLSRSNSYWDAAAFDVGPDAAVMSRCEEVADDVVAAIQKHSHLFGGHYRITLESSPNRDHGFPLKLTLHYDLSSSGHDLGAILDARTIMTCAMVAGMEHARIQFSAFDDDRL